MLKSYQLQNLVREAAHYLKIRHGIVEPKQVEVMIEDFETRVREDHSRPARACA